MIATLPSTTVPQTSWIYLDYRWKVLLSVICATLVMTRRTQYYQLIPLQAVKVPRIKV